MRPGEDAIILVQNIFNLVVDKIMIDRRVLLLNNGGRWFFFDDPCDVVFLRVSCLLKKVLNCSRQFVGEMVVSTVVMRRKWTVANETLGFVVRGMWLGSSKIVLTTLAVPRAKLTTIIFEEVTLVVAEELGLAMVAALAASGRRSGSSGVLSVCGELYHKSV